MLLPSHICSRLWDCGMVVYSRRCYTLYPILGRLCHPRQVLGFLSYSMYRNERTIKESEMNQPP